jgi:hypothetical protein
MGYFSNGSEGEMYHDDYCSRCVHDRNEDCPIWSAHLAHNYRDCNDDGSILHMLIPRSADKLSNEACRLFIEEPASGDLFPARPASQEAA